MLLAVPIRATTIQKAKDLILEAERVGDMTEIWLDHLEKIEMAKLRPFFKKPSIVVVKRKKEGGLWHGSEIERINLLIQAAEHNFQYVDLSLDTHKKLIEKLKRKKGTTKLIISYHNFKNTPSLNKLTQIMLKMKKLRPDIYKIATFATKIEDNLTLLNLLSKSQKTKTNLIVTCMGKQGRICRILASLFGSLISYAPLDKKLSSAPGQLTVKELRHIYRAIGIKSNS